MAEETEIKPEPKKPKTSATIVNDENEREVRIKALEENFGKHSKLVEEALANLRSPSPYVPTDNKPKPDVPPQGEKLYVRVLKTLGLAD